MAYYIAFDAKGQAIQSGGCLEEDVHLQCPQAAVTVITDDYTQFDTVYYFDNQVIPIPPVTNQYAKWDWESHGWIDDIDLAIATLNRAINTKRDELLILPIELDGNVFDADAQAITNISAWQVQIAAGVQLPSDFIWRDHHNNDCIVDADFINRLGSAIALRGTNLYKASWMHKEAINTLPFADLLSYSVDSGWI